MSDTGGQWTDPKTGAAMSHADVMARAAQAPVVLLGEQHDRADHHQWQLHVAAGIVARHSRAVMGFEMFPARLDAVLADWVAGRLSEEDFLRQVEWGTVWGFPPELYMPLFRFCRMFRLPMIGLNCRRDLVREIGAGGWDSVAPDAREGLTPAVPATPQYRRYLFDVTGGERPDRQAKGPMDPAFDRFVRAQQVWDRAFACRIAAARQVDDPPLVIAIIGRGHLEYRGGTPAQLRALGISDAVVLLPQDTGPVEKGIGDAVFCLGFTAA
ncbi:ChaN family lipoprotein [Roseinatronobacter sp. S2]|uniref:ChaN family lipoprotein n=1 Tax=Roseinatronobacter sp. S2 TaxID=3035471 RepID=UPI00240FBAA2|nr:ChaN family lipoprotein [Roseinatronobacter sp. S2]WFE74007.1 ChaN family lipoprotein [Roseinatronobacter sp. S2]